jgi:aryl-phospho-beta-D-glucosidase BglC (GH1 family)
MKFSGHAQTSSPYTIDAAFFTRIDTVLDQALAAHLTVIVDMHEYDEATNPSGPATITAQVAHLTSYQKAQGRTVYNSGWGPQDGGAMDSRVQQVTEVRKECEQAGIGWAIWDDPVNVNLFDSAAGTWVSQIIDALLQ